MKTQWIDSRSVRPKPIVKLSLSESEIYILEGALSRTEEAFKLLFNREEEKEMVQLYKNLHNSVKKLSSLVCKGDQND